MKLFLLAACILGMAVCAPQQMYMEFDIVHAPAQAEHLIPAGAPADTLDVLLPVDVKGRPIAGLGHGFIKQDVSWPNVKGTREVYYPFGFDPPKPSPVVPAAPVVPVAPVVPAAPAVPAAPVQRIVAASKPLTSRDSDWLSGELAPYKRRSNSAEDTINWNHLQHRQSSSPTVFYSRRTSTICKMKLIILCLCLASASAAPSIFHYLPHYAGSRPQVAPSQVRNPFAIPSLPQPGAAGAYSVELIYPHSFAGGAGGSNPAQPFASHGFMKISIPQPPGRQSVEVYYPYDFSQQRIMTNIPPMTNAPQMPHGLPFDFPQQIPNIPTFDTGFNALPSQDPLQTLHQDQPTQTNKMPTNV
ncbi:hypothetical protein JOQ06_013712 [Pogonophryne albipinna]|uniref:Secretory calcium-binding phosphoprotein 5 n=1 Tax=Pogonophryne albipinna TaxID=1090488 RepID=A0AAD6BJE4_9TELE|nr:hypothetical protein JOQ06_013712 [Pogonophryne albipinna]